LHAMNERTMIIMGQVFMVILAAVLAVAPRLYLVAVLAYFAVLFGVSMYRSRRAGGGVSREEIVRARTLLREEKAFEIALEDEEYIGAMSKQAKAMLIPLLLFPVYIWIFDYVKSLQSNLAGSGYDPRLVAFAVWLAAFEAMFLLNQAIRRFTAGKNAMAPLVPGGYRVTDKGIVFKGGLGQVIAFPLPEGTEVRLNADRSYVEIRLPGRQAPVRLYTKKARRLYDIIMRYGLGQGSTGDNAKERSA
jgi:uncharacterized membrane protein